MKKQTSTILASVLCFILVGITHSTIAQQVRTSQASRGSVSQPKARAATQQERVVRDVYNKLTELNRASNNLTTTDESLDGTKVIKFELSNFHIGPIGEIISKPHNEFVTGFAGELIEVTREVSVHNKQPERVAFGARWTQGQYASAYEPQWSIAQVFAFYPDEYYDIGSYASYEVTVTLQERTRHYKALALFSKAFDQHNEISPRLWDFVVGGSWLDRLLDEKRPAKEPFPRSSPPLEYENSTFLQSSAKSPESVTALLADSAEPTEPVLTELPPEPLSMTESSEAGLGSLVTRTVEDRTEHRSGFHGETVSFQGECISQPDLEQRCVVELPFISTTEIGEVQSFVFFHRWGPDVKSETATGPVNSSISCWAARGIAVSSCLLGACTVVGSLQGSGGEVRMTGGNVWNGQLAHRHTCRLSGSGPNCTTPGISGSCPPGTLRDAFGMCCANVGGGTLPDTCDIEFLRCHRSIGIFDAASCDCVPSSPIVIDINGNGISLTGAAEGVEFDLNGDGVRDHLGWTRENSDDAWLALDRNGNGMIDIGAELFGNFTAQPAAQKKNGFLALAEFDKQEQGGNGDGLIDQHDAIFSSLRLWQDKNHDGVSQSTELHTLGSMNIKSVGLDFKESKKTDEFGNEFRYRAKVNDTKAGSAGRWAWDVFLSH
ncbi:MAG TPA: hypothetical protein VL866_06660 [Pyrinomonadaceae bacterium]|nr:hypothetical protein [Pyrinomonadaceae bacterium]